MKTRADKLEKTKTAAGAEQGLSPQMMMKLGIDPAELDEVSGGGGGTWVKLEVGETLSGIVARAFTVEDQFNEGRRVRCLELDGALLDGERVVDESGEPCAALIGETAALRSVFDRAEKATGWRLVLHRLKDGAAKKGRSAPKLYQIMASKDPDAVPF